MRVEVNGTGLEVLVEGEGRPVVLLHGFPDSSRLWRNQIPALRDAGFQVISPDLRGYGGSDRPSDVNAYNLLFLASDVSGVLDHLGVERAHIVGHDWGVALAWTFATLAADRTDHLVAMSVGHPSGFMNAGMKQRELSWYMLLFQYAGVAEQWLSADGWANFRAWCHHPDADAVIADLERTDSLTPALNYYRANLAPDAYIAPPLDLPPITAPTMGMWSSNDFALVESQMKDSAKFVEGPWRYERLDGPDHWMQLEAPDEVNRRLIDFLPT